MDPNTPNNQKAPSALNNRPHLNFGAGNGFGTDRTYEASNNRVYPTTPSTFPQPVFQSQMAQASNDYLGAKIQSPTAASVYGNGGGYFVNQAFQQQQYVPQQQQPQYSNQYQQTNLPLPQPSYPQRQGGYNTHDPTTGLAHQFSNQNLGAVPRQGSPFGRHPSPSQPLRPAGPSSQHSYGSRLTIATSSAKESPSPVPHEPPEKNPEKYSSNVSKRGAGLHVFVESFFRDNIDRARERNAR